MGLERKEVCAWEFREQQGQRVPRGVGKEQDDEFHGPFFVKNEVGNERQAM